MSGKPAARVSDPTACPLPGHGTNPIAAGSGDVFFDGLAAARQGDASACGGALVGDLATTVLINGKPAATVGSVGAHGNTVTAGSGTVIIGIRIRRRRLCRRYRWRSNGRLTSTTSSIVRTPGSPWREWHTVSKPPQGKLSVASREPTGRRKKSRPL